MKIEPTESDGNGNGTGNDNGCCDGRAETVSYIGGDEDKKWNVLFFHLCLSFEACPNEQNNSFLNDVILFFFIVVVVVRSSNGIGVCMFTNGFYGKRLLTGYSMILL